MATRRTETSWRPRCGNWDADLADVSAMLLTHGHVDHIGSAELLRRHHGAPTSGHAGFHLPDRGTLVTGDALITVDLWDPSRQGPQVVRAPFHHDHARAVASLARYEPLDADVVVPGHGRPFTGTPAQAVAVARRGPGTTPGDSER